MSTYVWYCLSGNCFTGKLAAEAVATLQTTTRTQTTTTLKTTAAASENFIFNFLTSRFSFRRKLVSNWLEEFLFPEILLRRMFPSSERLIAQRVNDRQRNRQTEKERITKKIGALILWNDFDVTHGTVSSVQLHFLINDLCQTSSVLASTIPLKLGWPMVISAVWPEKIAKCL